MKKIWLFIVAVLMFLPLKAQTIVMEEDGGVYKVPCLVNGARMKFIFDTGASMVSLSLTMAEYLYENEYINDSDFISTGQSVIADGSVVDHMVINLRDIEIGGMHLRNVEATVLNSQNAPLLLGMSAIQKLGRVQINGNVLTIVDNRNFDKESRINELKHKINDYHADELFSKEMECWTELYELTDFSDNWLLSYATSCWFSHDYSKALEIVEKIDDINSIDIIDNPYFTIACIYDDNNRYSEAIVYYKKSLKIDDKEGHFRVAASTARCIGDAYYKKDDVEDANKYYKEASRRFYAIECNLRNDNIRAAYHKRDVLGELRSGEKSFRTAKIDYLDYCILLCEYELDNITFKSFITYMARMAENNNGRADQYLTDHNSSVQEIYNYIKYL